MQRPEGKPQAAAIAIAMHDWSLVITNGVGFVKFDKVYLLCFCAFIIHASCWSGIGGQFKKGNWGIGGSGYQGWVHAKSCKVLAHLFSTTLGTTGALGAGGALLGAATGALLGAGVLGCGLKFPN